MIDYLIHAWKTIFVEKKVPWRLQRIYSFVRINNFRLLFVPLRFKFFKPSMRIVLSTTFCGGVGGTEKLVKAVIESMPDCEFLVYADDVKARGFIPKTWNFRLNVNAKPNTSYDVYLYFCGGGKPKYLGGNYTFRTKIVDTNASTIFDIEDLFDVILVQAQDYSRWCTQHSKCVVAFPEIQGTIPKRLIPINDLPQNYILTVFNPFVSAQKNPELLIKMASRSKLPVVWCYSDITGCFPVESFSNVTNLLALKNLSQKQLYYAYKHAKAFVSLSTYESFGWALAEAFFMGLPIISRRTGIIPFVEKQQGITVYSGENELLAVLDECDFPSPNYDRSVFLTHTYRAAFENALIAVSKSC